MRTMPVGMSLLSLANCVCLLLSTLTRVGTPLIEGDSGAAVRSDGKTIDVAATITQLGAMHVNTYFYDLPHGTDAWEKLPAFLKLAQDKQINVYVYLAPWSLAKRGRMDEASEPFGTDFVRWFSEVGKLSVEHKNLVGVVMDDFASNANRDDRFTVQSVKAMLDAGRAANPALKFLPVLYFDDEWDTLMERFGPQLTDGVILCYPRSRAEVEQITPYIKDESHGASLSVELPRKHRLKPGQGSFAGVRVDANVARQARTLAFFLDDQNPTDKRGRHRVVVRVGDRQIWSRELASANLDRQISIPLKDLRANSEVSIGVIADEPNEEASVRVRIVNLQFIDEHGQAIAETNRWKDLEDDGITFQIANAVIGQHRWNIPLTLMVAGAGFEDEKRFREPGDAEHIGRRLEDALEWCRAGLANGVVLWWTSKEPDSPLPAVVGKAFAEK